MSKLISRSLPFLFVLTLAGVASARRPPAVVEAQERSESVYDTCAESRAQSTAGYRDMLSHVVTAEPSTQAVAAASVPPRKMGNHLVLVCAGGEIHQGSGYRDFPVRLRSEPSGPQFASRHELIGRQ
jgi:hypothetical protein